MKEKDGVREKEILLLDNRPVRCRECGGRLQYISGGKYECEKCGNVEKDDFGKVKDYLDEHGPTPAIVLASETGVHPDVIDNFLKTGRVEIPEGSEFYIKCERCGCNIRYGRFCPDCVRQLSGGIKKAFSEDLGEKPRTPAKKPKGKMHFIKKED